MWIPALMETCGGAMAAPYPSAGTERKSQLLASLVPAHCQSAQICSIACTTGVAVMGCPHCTVAVTETCTRCSAVAGMGFPSTFGGGGHAEGLRGSSVLCAGRALVWVPSELCFQVVSVHGDETQEKNWLQIFTVGYSMGQPWLVIPVRRPSAWCCSLDPISPVEARPSP